MRRLLSAIALGTLCACLHPVGEVADDAGAGGGSGGVAPGGGPGGSGGAIGGGTGGAVGGGAGGATGGGQGGAGGGAVDGGTRCAGLTQNACAATPGCVADFCTLCSCTPRYQACRSTSEATSLCPLVNCMQPICCHDAPDCSSAMVCKAPDESFGCGVCRPGSAQCAADTDCAAGAVCKAVSCACTPGATECVPGCPTTPCAIGQTCDFATHRCQSLPCTSSATCPQAFACVAGLCARKTCTADGDCGTGTWCVMGRCYDSLGQCGSPPP